jgi:hypothetical protein
VYQLPFAALIFIALIDTRRYRITWLPSIEPVTLRKEWGENRVAQLDHLAPSSAALGLAAGSWLVVHMPRRFPSPVSSLFCIPLNSFESLKLTFPSELAAFLLRNNSKRRDSEAAPPRVCGLSHPSGLRQSRPHPRSRFPPPLTGRCYHYASQLPPVPVRLGRTPQSHIPHSVPPVRVTCTRH